MTVITPLSEAHHRSLILAIFTSCGRARFMDEKYFDTCTALAGSGPAFVALVLEAMADGGVMMGLPRAEALELAAQSGFFFLYRPVNGKLMSSDIGYWETRFGRWSASRSTQG